MTDKASKHQAFVDALADLAFAHGVVSITSGDRLIMEPVLEGDGTMRYKLADLVIYWMPAEEAPRGRQHGSQRLN